MHTRWCYLLILCLGTLHAQSGSYTNEYDELFFGNSVRYLYGYLPDDDWRWFKAQCIQESQLQPAAISPAGAVGLCQLMSGASLDAGLHPDHRVNPERNIRAAAWILRRNLRVWFERDTRFHRLQLGWASYNAGAGNIIKAQTRCNGAILWAGIAPCLGYITGYNNSYETVTYVAIIPTWYQELIQ